MKVKIKSHNRLLSYYLSADKIYDVIDEYGDELFSIQDDFGNICIIYLNCCSHLCGGKWEVVDE